MFSSSGLCTWQGAQWQAKALPQVHLPSLHHSTTWHLPSLHHSTTRMQMLRRRRAVCAHATTANASQTLEGCVSPPLRRFTPRPLRHVRFTVPHYVSPPGQVLAVVGSWKELGSWDPSKSVHLEWLPGDAWSTDVWLPAEDGLEFKVVVVREKPGSFPECARWEKGENRVLDLKPSDQEQAEMVDVTCLWGIKPKGSSPSDQDTAIIGAVGVKPLVGLLDTPQARDQEAAAAALAKLACSNPSKKYWRGEIAAAGALPGLQKVAESFKATEAARQYAARAASKVQGAARELEKRQEKHTRKQEEKMRERREGRGQDACGAND